VLGAAIDELAEGLQELRELASGLHPSVLTERGLAAALEALAVRSPLCVDLARLPERKLPEPVEAAAYYVVAEAMANAQKHAGASRVCVNAADEEGMLLIEVVDDGAGGADPEGGGLRGLVDRVEALDGTLEVDSPAGGGTRVRARFPLG
jgi:signal transduction histidine kinase